MIRLVFFALLLFSWCTPTHAGFSVLRDSIGPDSSLTDGLLGGSTLHREGVEWSTPGFVVDVPDTGVLSQAQIVIFANDSDFNPEMICRISTTSAWISMSGPTVFRAGPIPFLITPPPGTRFRDISPYRSTAHLQA